MAERKGASVKTELPSRNAADVFSSVLTTIKTLTENPEGATRAQLQIDQEDVISASGYLSPYLPHTARRWLKYPAGWDAMAVNLRSADAGFSLQVRNVGADGGIVYKRSGFRVKATLLSDSGAEIQFSYIEELELDKYQRQDFRNPYWRHYRKFIQGLNKAGRGFIRSVNQEPTLAKMMFAQALTERTEKG